MIYPQTRNDVVTEYSYLCRRAARKFVRPGIEHADLQQIAAIGLIKACDRYDESSGTPFEAFAWLFIVGELMHFVRDHERLVRAPRRLRCLERRAQSAADALAAEFGREPTARELAERLGVRRGDVEELTAYREQAIAQSLDALEPHQMQPLSYTINEPETRLLVEHALSLLTQVERAIVLGLYARGYSQAEIAQRLGYSRRHVSRLHRGALLKMQQVCVPS